MDAATFQASMEEDMEDSVVTSQRGRRKGEWKNRQGCLTLIGARGVSFFVHVFFGNDSCIVCSRCHGCAVKGSENKQCFLLSFYFLQIGGGVFPDFP